MVFDHAVLSEVRMPLFLICLVLSCGVAYSQDAAMQASQQATQMANDQMMQASQQASQQAIQANQQANDLASQGCCVPAARPKFSVKAGTYSSAVTVR
jgi:hypothetical protein